MGRHFSLIKKCADLRPGDEVRAISLWEPWASLMRTGAKTIETRHWATTHRGPLLICSAGRRKVGELREYLSDGDFQAGLASLAPGRPVEIGDLVFGQALVLVDLYACASTETLAHYRDRGDDRIGSDRPFGNFSLGRYGWMTRNRRLINPFPVVGRQRLFRVTLPQDFI